MLLGLRNGIASDTNRSAAQSVYGQQLNIPGCIFDNITDVFDNRPPKREFQRKDAHIPTELHNCSHVWIKKPVLGGTLSRPYIGPFKIVDRNFENHTLILEMRGAKETIPMER